jgi:hypothetical protein
MLTVHAEIQLQKNIKRGARTGGACLSSQVLRDRKITIPALAKT